MSFASPAFAQTTLPAPESPEAAFNSDEIEVYTPDYFTQFVPQTAADMVARLPGFEIRGGGGDERGFGQASLNILINSRRPSSKSSGANQILGRIPASNVERIEIVDGASLNIPGLSGQVANIIAKTGELSGSWEYAIRWEEGSQPQLGDGEINVSGKRGNLEAVASLDFGQFIFTEDGDETFFDGDDNVIQDRQEKTGFNTQRPRANVNLTLLRDNGHIANLNLSGERRNTNISVFESFDDQTNPALSGDSEELNGSDRDTYEISGDYSLSAPLIGRDGQLKFIALHRGVNFDFQSQFLFNNGDTGESNTLFLREDEEREYIGRVEYRNLSRSWALSDKTNIQASVGAEFSVIDVPTSGEDSRSFFRPKGLLSASHKLNESWTVRGQVERKVGQLNFGTFVSSVSLTNDTETQGNDEIFPEQSWEAELEIQKQDTTGLSGRATVFYELIEDPITQLFSFDENNELVQGPGNLDSNAQVFGVRSNLTWDVFIRPEVQASLIHKDLFGMQWTLRLQNTTRAAFLD